jgi:hypothetical protein
MKKIIEWIAVIITLSGAVMTSMGIDPINIYLLNIGAFLWSVWGIIDGRPSIAIVNLGMLLIYLSGLLHRLGWIDFNYILTKIGEL